MKTKIYNALWLKIFCLALIMACVGAAAAQVEVIKNEDVIRMTEAGLSAELIEAKIAKTGTQFDVSADSLIALKKANVDERVIALMLEKADKALPGEPPRTTEPVTAETSATPEPKEAIKMAKTIAFTKSSAHPSRQNLEKALLKNVDFKKLGLTIMRYKDEADLFVEIGFVSGSWITHRYVYRIYDRRSGAVLSAGETTSWGSLGDNLAKHISRDLTKISTE